MVAALTSCQVSLSVGVPERTWFSVNGLKESASDILRHRGDHWRSRLIDSSEVNPDVVGIRQQREQLRGSNKCRDYIVIVRRKVAKPEKSGVCL